jgi:alpha-tubulin suppressor-like RCC1 family protein
VTIMKLAAFLGIGTACCIPVFAAAGCGEGTSGSSSPVPVATQYVVNLEATTVGGLGSCTAANKGAVGLVTSTASDAGVTDSLYYCVGGAWTAIACNAAASSSVAYVPGSPGSLFVCSKLAWTPIAIPPGAQGPQGDAGSAGPKGPQGDAGATGPQGPTGAQGPQGVPGEAGATGPQGDAGAESLIVVTPIHEVDADADGECPAGGEEIQVGIDTNGDGILEPSEVQHTAYVCNGTNATTEAGAGACIAGAVQCDGQQPQVCEANGGWNSVGPVCSDIVPGGGGGGAKKAEATESCCSGACVDTSSDPNNCGTCGNVCTTSDPNATGASCDGGGQCQPNCNAPFVACGTVCVNEQTDPNNCGGCGQVCSGSCVAGTCYAATAIAAGSATCAVLQAGTVYCWGDNTEGELGNGSASGPFSCVDTDRQCSYTPAPVNGLDQVTAVAAGAAHTCAIQSGGTLACWGYDVDGQLGDGEENGIIVPSPTPVPGLTSVVAVSAGQSHTCALLSDGTVDCWGSSETGQVGNGSNGIDVLSPTAVPGLTNVTAISAGYSHTCALLSDGTVQCWGDNGVGQLGLGSTSGPDACNSYSCSGCGCATTPVAVPGLTNAIAIAAGTFDTCAIIVGGTVECWGDNTYGQLGIGESTGPQVCTFGHVLSDYPCSTSPVPVSGLIGATAISLGVYQSDQACAIVAGGAVQCWGWNIYGQLGVGTLSGPETCAGYPCSTTPVTASGLTGVTAIVAGSGYTCAILPGGAVDCWGDAADGAVGDGTTGVGLYGGNGYSIPSPVAVVW